MAAEAVEVELENLPQIVADMPDEKLDEHLAKEVKGEFNEPEEKPGKEPAKDTPPENELEKLNKRLQDKETMIGRQANDIGTLRTQVAILQEQLARIQKCPQPTGDPAKAEPPKAKIDPDKFFEDPVSHVEKIAQQIVSNALSMQTKQQSEEKDKAEAARKATFEAVTAKVPVEEFSELMPTILEVLVEDEVDPDEINAFAADPLRFSPKAILSLIKRARLVRQVKGPEKTPEPPPAKAKPGNPGTVLNSKTGRGTESGKRSGMPSREQIAEMSDEELDAYLKQMNGG